MYRTQLSESVTACAQSVITDPEMRIDVLCRNNMGLAKASEFYCMSGDIIGANIYLESNLEKGFRLLDRIEPEKRDEKRALLVEAYERAAEKLENEIRRRGIAKPSQLYLFNPRD